MAKQLKKFCHITKYIEKTDPKLYELLDDLCVMIALRPRRGHNGITFIWPSKETIAKLDKMRYTDDVDKACDLILAHIVHDYLPNAAAWNAKKSDIPTGGNRKLEVKTVVGSKVTLADGAELEYDDKFKMMRADGQNQAVWRVTKGSIDHTKHTKTASFEHARQGAPAPRKTEGGDRRPRWHHAVGGSLIGHVATGGERHAVAPFGMLVAFAKALEKRGDHKLITELRLVLSYEMITTSAFVARSDSKLREALDDFRASPDARNTSQYGQNDYVKLVEAGHAALSKGKAGGAADVAALNQALSQAFKACKESSEKALAPLDLHADFTADTFTALNLSRAMEHACLRNIPKNEQLFSDKAAEIKELIELIEGRAAGHKGLETDTTSQSMGQLIASVFVAVDKFNKGPFVTYPFSAKKAVEDGKKQLRALYGADNSLSAQLAKLSPDELSTLFSNIAPREERAEVEAEAAVERTEAIDDVKAPEA